MCRLLSVHEAVRDELRNFANTLERIADEESESVPDSEAHDSTVIIPPQGLFGPAGV